MPGTVTSSNRVARRDPALAARISGVRALSAGGPIVRAGSGLVRVGGRLLAIQDDAWEGVWIDPVSGALEPLPLAADSTSLPKARKPDFEAVFDGGDALYVVGSGATPQRCAIVRLAAGAVAEVIDAAPLFEAIARAIGGVPNVEGAVGAGARVLLFNRGAAGVPNAVLAVAMEGLRRGEGPVLHAQAWDLGAIDGIPLTFTDAAALGDGRIVYLAAAENTPDAVADGPVVGAVIGIIDEDAARWNVLRDADGTPSRRKVEGLALDPASRSAWLLTDPDDAARPAELCRLELGPDFL